MSFYTYQRRKIKTENRSTAKRQLRLVPTYVRCIIIPRRNVADPDLVRSGPFAGSGCEIFTSRSASGFSFDNKNPLKQFFFKTLIFTIKFKHYVQVLGWIYIWIRIRYRMFLEVGSESGPNGLDP
jgi:hypothetical protein